MIKYEKNWEKVFTNILISHARTQIFVFFFFLQSKEDDIMTIFTTWILIWNELDDENYLMTNNHVFHYNVNDD